MTRMQNSRSAIEELVHLETRAWDTQDVELLLSLLHPDMVWPWPPHPEAHDPLDWVLVWGRFDRARWGRGWEALFESHELIHNRRVLQRIEVSAEGDGGFAVVDVDTLWRHRINGSLQHWRGRACKLYTRLAVGDWRMIAQTGLLDYGSHRQEGA
jgi:ketosteroid isomerase-like protein